MPKLRGKSNSSGFWIEDIEKGIFIKTEHYVEGEVIEVAKLKKAIEIEERKQSRLSKILNSKFLFISGRLISVLASFFLFFCLTFLSFEKIITWTLILLLGCSLFLILVLGFLSEDEIYEKNRKLTQAVQKDREFLQWHACEHKVIQLLEKQLEPTLANLQKMPMTSPECGASFYQNAFLKEPSLEKLIEGLRVVQEYYQKSEKNKH